jgi:hypothetical protein
VIKLLVVYLPAMSINSRNACMSSTRARASTCNARCELVVFQNYITFTKLLKMFQKFLSIFYLFSPLNPSSGPHEAITSAFHQYHKYPWTVLI